ncbi:hypothetical protein B0H13DRAFT_1869480 [Mycena leptocephala]|nr:hypothetical protein B0H13DRAFT_1869480 [Mycena leptocephala]
MPLSPGTKESYIGTLLENIIYGFYLSASVKCWALLWKKKTGDVKHVYLMTTAALMFILITTRCIIDTYRCIAAFDAPEVDFGPPNSTPGNLTNICLVLLIAIADIFMIFRTFIVWNKRWVIIIIPVVLSIVNFGMGVWTVSVSIKSATSNAIILETLVPETVLIFVALTLATNLVCTGLIAYRIIHVHQQLAWMVPRTGKSRSQSLNILSVFVESAAIYTLLLVPTLICAHLLSLGTFTVFILTDIISPTIGLILSYIIIAVSRGTSFGENTTSPTSTSFGDFGARVLVVRRTHDTHDLDQSVSVRSSTRPGVHIELEEKNHEPRPSRDDELHLGKYSPTAAV